VTPWTVAHQASPSMGFSRQEYWSGLPFPLLGDLPDPAIKPMSPAWQAESLLLSHKSFPQSSSETYFNSQINTSVSRYTASFKQAN